MYVRLFGYFTPDGGTRWPYLRNIDSYFFLRHIGDTVNAGGIFPIHDNLINAPYGADMVGQAVYYYAAAYPYMLFNSLFKTDLWIFLAWFAPLLASLVAIPMYFMGKALFDRKAGVLAALFMTIAIPFMGRSLGGDPDSDAIVMLIAMTSVAMFIIMSKYFDRSKILTKKNVLLSVLTGLAVALFAHAWSGYWFTIFIAGGFLLLKLVADFLLHRKHKEDHMRVLWKHSKNLLALSVLALLVFEALTVPFLGAGFAFQFITTPLSSMTGAGYKGEAGIFPNVGVSIAELMSGGDAKQVISQASGLDTAASVSGLPIGLLTVISPFVLTLAGLMYLGYSYYKRREHLDTLLLMVVWFGGFLTATMVAVRFSIFLVPVFALCSGIILSKLWRLSAGEDRSLGA
jgi:asparagine N-glycosylation enzyme membrane subunit Stt3